jgi:ribosomal-protein-alanine N-acetyltransferase
VSDSLELRPAVVNDVSQLAAIDALLSPRPMSEAQYQGICEGGSLATGIGLVAGRGAQVCGFAVYAQVLDEGSIINIAVAPACQGLGYGRQLLARALVLLRENGAGRCLLEVRESNRAARALYESEGFTVDGRRSGYYSTEQGSREDALLMSKQL